jgi:hypothetical protein
MDIKKLLNDLKGQLSEREFYDLTGINRSTAWKMSNNESYACPPGRALILYNLAKKKNIHLSREDMAIILLGRFSESLPDLDLLVSGKNSLDEWVKCGPQTYLARGKIIGLDYSTVFYKRIGKRKKSWPKRAIEIVRKSGYQIDLFDLLGTKREWFDENHPANN